MSHQLNIILIHKHEKEVLDGLFVLSKITIFRKLITRNKRRSTMIEPEQEYQYIMLAQFLYAHFQYPQFVIYVFYHYYVMFTSRQKEILFAWPFLHSFTFFLVIDSLYSFKKKGMRMNKIGIVRLTQKHCQLYNGFVASNVFFFFVILE